MRKTKNTFIHFSFPLCMSNDLTKQAFPPEAPFSPKEFG